MNRTSIVCVSAATVVGGAFLIARAGPLDPPAGPVAPTPGALAELAADLDEVQTSVEQLTAVDPADRHIMTFEVSNTSGTVFSSPVIVERIIVTGLVNNLASEMHLLFGSAPLSSTSDPDAFAHYHWQSFSHASETIPTTFELGEGVLLPGLYWFEQGLNPFHVSVIYRQP